MQLQDTLLTVLQAHGAHANLATHPLVARASLGIPDTLAIFVVALVVFGPKRLPEIGKQIGKLVFEFRRASNDFKLQIEEELRLAEQQDRQKVLDMQAAANQPATPVALSAGSTTSAATSETSATPAIESPQSVEPQPPDRHVKELTSSDFHGLPTESAKPVIISNPEASAEPSPLTVRPPSTGTLVSALPPNHAAAHVMTAIPPAGASLETDSTIEEAIHDTTAHNG